MQYHLPRAGSDTDAGDLVALGGQGRQARIAPAFDGVAHVPDEGNRQNEQAILSGDACVHGSFLRGYVTDGQLLWDTCDARFPPDDQARRAEAI